MIQDLQELEAQLQTLRPAATGSAFAERLAAIAQRAPSALSPDDVAVEHSLRTLAPAPLPAALQSAILDRTSRRSGRLVSFPAAAPLPASRRWNRFALPIAAAVALLGAATALLVPTGQIGSPNTAATAGNSGAERITPTPAAPIAPRAFANGSQRFVPAGLDSSLRRANDEQVIWTSPSEAHRVLEIIYNDRVTVKDQHGREYPIERPRVEYILIPEKID